jgi:hypothetical protein
MDRAMRRMKELGVTVNVIPAAGRDGDLSERPSGVIAEYARKHGIYHETKEGR